MVKYKNDLDKPITFKLDKAEYDVKPGEEVSIPENLDYAIRLMGVKLTPVSPAPEEVPPARGRGNGR